MSWLISVGIVLLAVAAVLQVDDPVTAGSVLALALVWAWHCRPEHLRPSR